MVTNSAWNVATGATNTVLTGQGSGTTPTFSGTPTLTSISFGDSALSTYAEAKSWSPTMRGATTAGTPSYTFQFGLYTRIGTLVFASFNVFGSLSGSAGSFQVGGFPFAANSTTNYNAQGVVWQSGLTNPAGTISVSLALLGGTTTAQILSLGGSVYYSTANTTINCIGTIAYFV
jgi:hypothetical protein